VNIGAYRKGANRTLDAAVEMRDAINAHLRQRVDERLTLDQVRQELLALAANCQAKLTTAAMPAAVMPLPAAAVAQPVVAKKRPTVIKKV